MNKKETYSQLLKDPRWQRKRLEIMQRDDFTCQHCGCKDRSIQVHHILYQKGKKPWEYENEHLITLCDRCHNYESDYNGDLYNQFVELKEAFKVRGFSMELLSSIIGDIDSVVRYPNEIGKNNLAVKLIEYCICGTQNISDCIAAKKLGYEVRDILQTFHPEYLNKYDKTIKEF